MKRLILTLKKINNKELLKNNNRALQKAVYALIEKHNPVYTNKLHNINTLKFTFSKLNILNGVFQFTISTASTEFFSNLFKSIELFEIIDIYGVSFKIENKQIITYSINQETVFINDNWGIAIVKSNGEQKHYVSPYEENYQHLFFERINKKLDNKYTNDELKKFKLIIKSKPIQQAIYYKNQKIISWKFDFQLECPEDMKTMGFYSGFGNKNTIGLGFTNIKNII